MSTSLKSYDASCPFIKDVQEEHHEVCHLIQTALEQVKSEDILWLQVAEKTTMCDVMVIASVAVSRQASVAAETLRVGAKALGIKPNIEGRQESWVLIDLGAFVIHILDQEGRLYYDLEGIWAD